MVRSDLSEARDCSCGRRPLDIEVFDPAKPYPGAFCLVQIVCEVCDAEGPPNPASAGQVITVCGTADGCEDLVASASMNGKNVPVGEVQCDDGDWCFKVTAPSTEPPPAANVLNVAMDQGSSFDDADVPVS